VRLLHAKVVGLGKVRHLHWLVGKGAVLFRLRSAEEEATLIHTSPDIERSREGSGARKEVSSRPRSNRQENGKVR
jgi:hypothetical protein